MRVKKKEKEKRVIRTYQEKSEKCTRKEEERSEAKGTGRMRTKKEPFFFCAGDPRKLGEPEEIKGRQGKEDRGGDKPTGSSAAILNEGRRGKKRIFQRRGRNCKGRL